MPYSMRLTKLQRKTLRLLGGCVWIKAQLDNSAGVVAITEALATEVAKQRVAEEPVDN
jgi:hypothetical protein